MLYSSGEQNILGGASFSAPVNRVFILHNNAPSKHWEISTFIIYACPGIRLIYLDLYFHQGANSGTWYFSSVGWMLYFAPALCESLKVLKLKLDSPLKAPADVCLPKLKILFLSHIIFLDIFSIWHLFSSCPFLKNCPS